PGDRLHDLRRLPVRQWDPVDAAVQHAVRAAGLPVAALLAADPAELAAGLEQSRAPDPVDPARLPGHLLLLPEGLLPLLLRPSARLRGRGADRPPPLQDGDGVPVHPPEPPPLLPVPGVLPAVLPLGGHRSGACPGRPAPARARWADHGRQRHAADRLLTVLPLAPASRRRP